MSENTIECVYCGGEATDWDHLRPLVSKRRPTGHLTDFRNLVPACGSCNQSKSGQAWHAWMYSDAKRSPKTRNVPDIDFRATKLMAFEEWGNVSPVPFEQIIGAVEWEKYWSRLQEIENLIRQAQSQADDIRNRIEQALN